MISNPLVSVLMPVYNCDLYVAEAIDSILNQTYSNFEFLIIDDASTDNTGSIVKKYSDPRIIFIEKPQNTGYTNSLNYGLTIAKGKYIARMDGDDISLPERFDKQVAFMDAHIDVVALGTTYSFINTNRIKYVPNSHDEIKHTLLNGPCIGHPTVMLRKEIFDKHNIKYELIKEPAEDYDLWVRLLKYGKLHNLDDVLLDYRIHEAQVSKKRQKQQLKSTLQTKIDLFSNYLEHDCTNEELKALKHVISINTAITFQDIKLYKSAKIKLVKANKNLFFQDIKLQKHFTELEKDFFNNFFLKRKKYNYGSFLMYLKVCFNFSYRLSIIESVKLFVKSIVLFKNKL